MTDETTDELIRAVDQYIRDSHAQNGALREARAEPLSFDAAYNMFSQVKEHVDDYRAVIKEHEETISRCQSEARRLGRELNAAKAEVEQLQKWRREAEAAEIDAIRRLAALGCVCAGYETQDCVACRAQRALEKVK